MALRNEKFCVIARGNSVKSRGTTHHKLCKCLLVLVANSSDMNDGVYKFHMRVTIVDLLTMGHSAAKIHTLLRPLKLNKHQVYHVKKLFKDTGDICDHPRADQLCSTRMKNVVNAVRIQIT